MFDNDCRTTTATTFPPANVVGATTFDIIFIVDEHEGEDDDDEGSMP